MKNRFKNLFLTMVLLLAGSFTPVWSLSPVSIFDESQDNPLKGSVYPVGASGFKTKGFRPNILNESYFHNRWGTLPEDILFKFRGYTSSFDSDREENGEYRRIPEWVSYELRQMPENLPDYKRPSKWFTFPELFAAGIMPEDESYHFSKQYREAHPEEPAYDRGHMARKKHVSPLGEDADWNTHTFLNACPQRDILNREIWLDMEDICTQWANRYGKIWVICGPIFNSAKILPGDISMGQAFIHWLKSASSKEILHQISPLIANDRIFYEAGESVKKNQLNKRDREGLQKMLPVLELSDSERSEAELCLAQKIMNARVRILLQKAIQTTKESLTRKRWTLLQKVSTPEEFTGEMKGWMVNVLEGLKHTYSLYSENADLFLSHEKLKENGEAEKRLKILIREGILNPDGSLKIAKKNMSYEQRKDVKFFNMAFLKEAFPDILIKDLEGRKVSEWLGEEGELKVAIPDAFYKIVIREGKDSDHPKVLSFIYPQEPDGTTWPTENGCYNHAPFLCSIERIEKKTGLSFLNTVEKSSGDLIRKKTPLSLWPYDPQKISAIGSWKKTKSEEENTGLYGKGEEYRKDHPLVMEGRIKRIESYKDMEGLSLPEYAEKFKKKEGSEVRLYFDLDLTLFRSMGWISSSNWFEYTSSVFGLDKTLDWWGRGKRYSETHEGRQIENDCFFRPVEQGLSQMLKELSAKGVEVIGLTARGAPDQERTRKILKALDLDLSGIIFCGGSGKTKAVRLDEYEKTNGKAPSLYFEDSFSNLVSVLPGRAHIQGFYYDAPSLKSEDFWSYKMYLQKAEESYQRREFSHSFEYYYNAVIKIFTLKELSLEQALKELKGIHTLLIQKFPPEILEKKISGFELLLNIVRYGYENRSYFMEDENNPSYKNYLRSIRQAA